MRAYKLLHSKVAVVFEETWFLPFIPFYRYLSRELKECNSSMIFNLDPIVDFYGSKVFSCFSTFTPSAF